MSKIDFFRPRYMTRFHCIGTACEDSCCSDWTIFYDEKHYRTLEAKMTSPEERAELEAGTEKLEGEPPARFALLVLREDRTCKFLDPERLCTIHGRFGEETLSDVCATYPRVIGRAFDRIEVVGTLSCPEIARQVLLHEDSLERVPTDVSILDRRVLNRSIDHTTRDPYEGSFLAVRGAMLQLVRPGAYPLGTRLFFLAFFAESTREYFRRGAPTFDFPGLQRLAMAMQLEENQEKLAAQLPSVPYSDRFAVSVVQQLLVVSETFTPMRTICSPLRKLYAAAATHEGEDEVDIILRVYQGLPPLPPDQAARFDAVLDRYLTHDLIHNWYTEEPSFLIFAHKVLVRLAFFRFLVRSHAAMTPPADVAAFDALVVRIVYLISRIFEHSKALADGLFKGLEAAGMSLPSAVSLIRI